MWLDEIKNLELPKLTKGAHKKDSKELCLMELIAFMEREPHSDKPGCVCPTMMPLGILLNDTAPDDDFRQRLLRLAPMLVGTVTYEDRAMPPESYVAEQDLYIVRQMQNNRMHERYVTTAERRVYMLERFARHIAGDERMRGIHAERHYRDNFHWNNPYERARELAASIGDTMSRFREDHVGAWLMGYAILEAMIIAGPHTPEIEGWVAPRQLKRAKQWVKEYAPVEA